MEIRFRTVVLMVTATLAIVPDHLNSLLALLDLRARPCHPRKSSHTYSDTVFGRMTREGGKETILFEVGIIYGDLKDISVVSCSKIGREKASISNEACVPSENC